MLTSTYNRGFQLTFENGNTISVQFGRGNYCNRKDFNPDMSIDLKEQCVSSKNAEVAIWNGDYVFKFDGNSERRSEGWCDANEVAKLILFASTIVLDESNSCVDK